MDEIRNQNPDTEIIYIDKEDYQYDAIKTYVDLMNYLQTARKGNGKCYLFIDEIQDIKNFEIALRSLQSDPDWDISCSGSNASLLSGELAYLFGWSLCADSHLFINIQRVSSVSSIVR